MSKEQHFDSVWDAIEDTPEEAENMKLRSVLMMVLKEYIEQIGADATPNSVDLDDVNPPDETWTWT